MPVEIKLNIIGHLDAKSVQRTRRVCTELKSFFDIHKDSLAQTVNDKNIARLQAFIQYHDYKDVSLLDAVSRWVAHRGLWLEGSKRDLSIVHFCEHFCVAKQNQLHGTHISNVEVQSLVEFLLLTHLNQHEGYFVPRSGDDYPQIDLLLQNGLWSASHEQLTLEMQQEVLADQFRFSTALHQYVNTYHASNTHHQLTPKVNSGGGLTMGRIQSNLHEDLDVPQLAYSFAYYVDGPIAEQRVRAMIASGDNKNTRSLRRAAVLGDLFIC